MAKFKPYKILESQLDSLPIQEGQFILTTDTKKLYSDTAANTRILLSQDTITDLSISGTTITYTRLDGTTGTINITKSNLGLSNVENKSSATIRGEITSANVTTALGYTPINSNLKGANSGLAELDAAGKVPISQLPSYVDDVLEYDAKTSFPATGETGKIYIDKATNKSYRWGGSDYAEISASLALGSTSSTAFRGDYGQIAYDHATAHGSAFSSGLYKIATNAEGHVTEAIAVEKDDITALGIPAENNDTTYTLEQDAEDGHVLTLTPSEGAATTIIIPDSDTTYEEATSSTAGLMSAADKAKLDEIPELDKVVVSSNESVDNIVSLTKAEYDALEEKEVNTLYNITDDDADNSGGVPQDGIIAFEGSINDIPEGYEVVDEPNKLIAGDNIKIENNTISATYTAGKNIDINGNEISAKDPTHIVPVCRVGSDTAGTAGWYKVASSTMSGHGNTNIVALVKASNTAGYTGLYTLEMRSNSTNISVHTNGWFFKGKWGAGDLRVVINGMTWTLYVKNPSSQWGRVYFTVLSHFGITGFEPMYPVTWYNSTAPEATEPSSTYSSTTI